MPVNKVVYGSQTIIDLTDSTLSSASDLMSGVTAYDRGGNLLTGTGVAGSEWTSGIYLDEDGYIRVSPLGGAGGVNIDNEGCIVFSNTQFFDGGSITVTDESNSTGITCVITTGSTPAPSETWETIYDGNMDFYYDSNGGYPYCWRDGLGTTYPITLNSVWRITYANTEYRCTCTLVSNGVGIIGNPIYMGYSDDGSDYPFAFASPYYGAWTGGLNAPNEANSFYFKIEKLVSE